MGKKTKSLKLPAILQLTPKQQNFVHERASGKDLPQAVMDAGYDTQKESNARAIGSALMQHPAVKQAIAEIIEDRHPAMKVLATKTLERILKGETSQTIILTCPHCKQTFNHQIELPSVKDADQLKAIETLCKITGDFAPKKSASLNVNLDRFKLPKE